MPTCSPAAWARTSSRAAPAPTGSATWPERYADVSLAATSNRLTAGSGPDRVDTANGRRDVVHCGAGRDRAIADREDRLAGCERKKFLRSPLPEAAPRAGGRARMFMVRFRALEEVASQGEQFLITVNGPSGLRARSKPARSASATAPAPRSDTG